MKLFYDGIVRIISKKFFIPNPYALYKYIKNGDCHTIFPERKGGGHENKSRFDFYDVPL